MPVSPEDLGRVIWENDNRGRDHSMQPAGVPPLAPGSTGAAPKTAIDYLARPIGDVCQNQQGVLPMNCYSPAKGRVPSGQDLLHNGTPPAPVGAEMAERLLSALASIINGDNTAARAVTNRLTIRQFRSLSEGEQTDFINEIWGAVATAHAFNQRPSVMFDPDYDDTSGDRPLPTSICPVAAGANAFRKRLSGKQPFRELGVGFRVDGSDDSSITRIIRNGMTQQRLAGDFMLVRRGLRLDGTVMMDATQARVWTGNHDIFNESAVCVSRNFFGGTAFPERETNGLCYLWAVDCLSLDGFDTEGYQLGLGGARQWRPGEKAFPSIPAARVLGYVQIDRRGAPATGGWRVDISKDAKWTLTGSPSVAQRVYMEDELAAWRGGSYTIPATFDFAT